jgi:hypothetical protein
MHQIVADHALVNMLHLDAVGRRIVDVVSVVMHIAVIDRVVAHDISFDVISPELDPIAEVFDLQIFYNQIIMSGIEDSGSLILAIRAIARNHAVQCVSVAIDHDAVRTNYETVP